MKKHLKYKGYPETPEAKPDVGGLILGIQQQLLSLERKVDTLINRSANRPFEEKQRAERPSFKAICADCSKECEVPFRPSQDRPVYCKECFSKRRANDSFKPSHGNRPADRKPARERPFEKYRTDDDHRPASKKRPLFKGKQYKKIK